MIPLCLTPVKKEWEENGKIGWNFISPSHSSLESKKSLEERENAGVDPMLAIPVIQKGCTPNEEGAAGEPRAETVSWSLIPLQPQPLFSLSTRLASPHTTGKVCV